MRLENVSSPDVPNVVKTYLYWPELFGQTERPWAPTLCPRTVALVGGEREMFAAFVSKLNPCVF